MREGVALSRLEQLGVNAPRPVFYGARKVDGLWQGVLVTEDLGGFIDLDTWYGQGAASLLTTTQHLRLLERLAQMLARLHSANGSTVACVPTHLYQGLDYRR
ncbi:lipopolysaccharide kinase InaA family protein [Pseudomonas parakoreensis]